MQCLSSYVIETKGASVQVLARCCASSAFLHNMCFMVTCNIDHRFLHVKSQGLASVIGNLYTALRGVHITSINKTITITTKGQKIAQ